MTTPKLCIKRLSTGYVRIQGDGICEWAQVAYWPCPDEVLEEGFFAHSSDDFRREVRRAMGQYLKLHGGKEWRPSAESASAASRTVAERPSTAKITQNLVHANATGKRPSATGNEARPAGKLF